MARRELWTPETPALESLRIGAHGFADAPPGNDIVNQHIGHAILLITDRDNELRTADEERLTKFFEEKLGVREPIPPQHAIGLVANWIKEGILYPDENDPYEMTTDPDPFAVLNSPEAVCKFAIEYWKSDLGQELGAEHFEKHNVVATSPNRYALPMLVATILRNKMRKRIGRNLHVADIGTSDMREIKRWALRGYLNEGGPQPPEIVEPHIGPSGEIEYITNETATERTREMWKDVGRLAIGVGLDSMDVRDWNYEKWFDSSDRPGAYKHGVKREQHALFASIRPNNTVFVQADITDLDFSKVHAAARKAGAIKKHFDIAMALTMLYELSPEKQVIGLHTMAELVKNKHGKEQGVVIVEDFGRADPNDPGRLLTDVHSFGQLYEYRLLVYADGVLREWFRIDTGRVTKAMISAEFGMVGNKRVVTAEEIFGITPKYVA